MRLLLVIEDAELTEEFLLAERIEFFAEVGERIGAHSRPV
jgi:hypothetical protein